LALGILAGLLVICTTVLLALETTSAFATIFGIAGLVIVALLAGIIVFEARQQ
jgi:hypothetical protein